MARTIAAARRILTILGLVLTCAVGLAQTEAPTFDETKQATWDAAALRHSLEPGQSTVTRQGPTLVITYRGEGTSIGTCCGIQLPLHELPGTNIWVLKVYVPDLDRAVLSIDLLLETSAGSPTKQIATHIYRGPAALPPVEPATTLRGTTSTVHLTDSDLPTGGRDLSIYQPPPALRTTSMNALYVLDGSVVPELARYVEPLILSHAIPPTLLIGIHSLRGKARWQEYMPDYDPPRYRAMEAFVVGRVVPWAQAHLHAGSTPAQRAILGMSNGADFALSLSLRHPTTFGTVLGFSAGVVQPTGPTPPPDLLSRYYLEAGTLEPGFLENTTSFYSWLKQAGIDAHMDTRIAGHDDLVWHEELVRDLLAAYGPSPAPASSRVMPAPTN